MNPDIALAASARSWPDRIHRHILDHGGGTIVARPMGPEQTIEASFDVLFIDDVCSFLTPRLVAAVKRSDSEVVGVFAPEDGTDAKRRLLECGISSVIESDATPTEFISAAVAAIAHRSVPSEALEHSTSSMVGIVGSTDGVGTTEFANALAAELAVALTRVGLVDLDPLWPSVAQRLDLPLHPNIRSALDAVIHQTGELGATMHQLGALRIVGGVADQGTAAPISRHEASSLLEEIGRRSDVVVADLGALDRVIGGLLNRFDLLLLVGRADPVGITRLFRCAERLLDTRDAAQVLLVVNMAPRGRFHQSEIRMEVQDAFGQLPLALLPHDKTIAAQAWSGEPVSRGAFRKAVREIARLIAGGSER